jgi:hypothetical protein
MKLVPFFLTKRIQKNLGPSDLTIYKLMVFLDKAGKQSWSTEDDDPSEKELMKDYLEPNGFIANKIVIHSKKSLALIEVNQEQLKLNDFYNWDEALAMQTKPECWRAFYFFKDTQGDEWWSPKHILDAEVQGLGSIYLLFLDILRDFTKTSYDELSSGAKQ